MAKISTYTVVAPKAKDKIIISESEWHANLMLLKTLL